MIDKFLGLNLDSTDGLDIQQGELSVLKNIRITENYKMRKREGYTKAFSAGGGGKIQGVWFGKLGGNENFVFARDGHLYGGNISTGAATDIGTVSDSKIYLFAFNDKLYSQNGSEYKSWEGTGSLTEVRGYIPKVAIATPPSGGGTLYEDINSLIGMKHQTFNGNGTATSYHILETAVTSIDSLYIDGVLKTPITSYCTVNTTSGLITPITASVFTKGDDNIDIYWTKGTGSRQIVEANKQSELFGGANDSRVFMYGVDNKVIYSALADGNPSAEYFPENNYLLLGSDEYGVTHLSKQYDRLIVHKEKDSHYCTYELDATTGASFPTYPLNDSVGNVAFGQGRNILNNPFVVTNGGVFQFTATNVRDEKNVVFTSERVQIGLDDLDLGDAITMDWEKRFEYWLFVGNIGYVYNYKNDTWYYFELAHTPTCFLEINGIVYFGTTSGEIMKFDEDALTDNGLVIKSRWETGFLSFGANNIRKFINFVWIGMQPEKRSLCYVNWESDKTMKADNTQADIRLVEYNNMDFGNVDFGNFTFNTSYSPQPFRLKLKIKKFTYVKFIGYNESLTNAMTVLNLTLPTIFGGFSK